MPDGRLGEARGGLLVSHRGLKGGYRLSRPSKEITVADILTAISGPIAITECAEHGVGCEHEGSCPTRGNWRLIDQAIRKALEEVTLDQMARPGSVIPSKVEQKLRENLAPSGALEQGECS